MDVSARFHFEKKNVGLHTFSEGFGGGGPLWDEMVINRGSFINNAG